MSYDPTIVPKVITLVHPNASANSEIPGTMEVGLSQPNVSVGISPPSVSANITIGALSTNVNIVSEPVDTVQSIPESAVLEPDFSININGLPTLTPIDYKNDSLVQNIDNLIISELLSYNLSRIESDQQVSIIDTISLHLSLVLTDNINLTDTVQTAISASNFVTDNTVLSDPLYINFFKNQQNESVAITDSGIITIQDYVDPTYLAEDYVGVSYTF